MEIDIAILIIVAIFALLGLKNGLIYTLFHTLGWLVSLVISVLFHSPFQALLKDRTPFYEMFYRRVEYACLEFAGKYTDKIPDNLPGNLDDSIRDMANNAAIATAERIANTAFGIAVFILMIFLIKLILYLITRLFSKRYHRGFIGGLDGVAGLGIGIVQGAIVVLVLMAFLMPVAYAFSPDAYTWVNTTLERSFFAYNIYNANPLLDFVGAFSPNQFVPKLPDVKIPEPVKEQLDGMGDSLA
jgi:uncharacterized membrane protein required for colicin V production